MLKGLEFLEDIPQKRVFCGKAFTMDEITTWMGKLWGIEHPSSFFSSKKTDLKKIEIGRMLLDRKSLNIFLPSTTILVLRKINVKVAGGRTGGHLVLRGSGMPIFAADWVRHGLDASQISWAIPGMHLARISFP